MGLLAVDQTPVHFDTDSPPDTTENVGAQAPTLHIAPPRMPILNAEPYRPASATRVALRPNRFILNKVKRYCLDNEITLTHFFEKTALEYLESHAPEYGRPGAKAPLIDKIDLKKEEALSSVAQVFQFWTAAYNRHSQHFKGQWKPTWTDRDKTLEHELREMPITIIEVGILRVITNKKLGGNRINSFQYYFAEIHANAEDLLKLAPETLNFQLHWYRYKVAKYLHVDCPGDSLAWLKKNGAMLQ